MTDSFKQLIEVAFDIKVFFNVPSYTLFQYEDGSYVDFHVRKINNLPKLIELSCGLEIRLFGDNEEILVRVMENYDEV